jgi:hypothetical protein
MIVSAKSLKVLSVSFFVLSSFLPVQGMAMKADEDAGPHGHQLIVPPLTESQALFTEALLAYHQETDRIEQERRQELENDPELKHLKRQQEAAENLKREGQEFRDKKYPGLSVGPASEVLEEIEKGDWDAIMITPEKERELSASEKAKIKSLLEEEQRLEDACRTLAEQLASRKNEIMSFYNDQRENHRKTFPPLP